MTSVNADLRNGRRLETGCRSESIMISTNLLAGVLMVTVFASQILQTDLVENIVVKFQRCYKNDLPSEK